MGGDLHHRGTPNIEDALQLNMDQYSRQMLPKYFKNFESSPTHKKTQPEPFSNGPLRRIGLALIFFFHRLAGFGEGVDAMPDWDMTNQTPPDYPDD